MSPSHTKKGARRYRYYVTHMSACIEEGPPAWRMPALETEAAVVRRLQLWLQDRRAIRDMLPDDSAAEELEAVITMTARAVSRMEDPSHRRRIVSQAVGAVQVEVDHLRITLNVQGLSAVFRRQFDSAIAAPVLTASGARVRQGRATKLVFAGDDGCATEVDPALIRLLREGQEARAAMVRFPTLSVSQIAQQRKVCRHRLRRVIKLSWLEPDIITAIVEGRHPASLTAKRLLDADLPVDWAGQKRMLGFA